MMRRARGQMPADSPGMGFHAQVGTDHQAVLIDRKRVDIRDVPLEHVVEVVDEEVLDVRHVENRYAHAVGFSESADGPQRLPAREVPHDGNDQVPEMQALHIPECIFGTQETGEFSFFRRTCHQVPERWIGQAVSQACFGVADRKLFFVERPVDVEHLVEIVPVFDPIPPDFPPKPLPVFFEKPGVGRGRRPDVIQDFGNGGRAFRPSGRNRSALPVLPAEQHHQKGRAVPGEGKEGFV